MSKYDFSKLNFEDFKILATRKDLSNYEKIGFPDDYRADQELLIAEDIQKKLVLEGVNSRLTIWDIGAGCSSLPSFLTTALGASDINYVAIDSWEMLQNLNLPKAEKWPGKFPDDFKQQIESSKGTVDRILVYSVLQYVRGIDEKIKFLDAILSLLSAGGRCLIGDIPNIDMRERYFATAKAKQFHEKNFQGKPYPPPVDEQARLNFLSDNDVLSLMSHARQLGFHSFVVPQDPKLLLSARREDLLIVKP